MPSAAERQGAFGAAGAAVLATDLATKAVVEATLRRGEVVPVFGEWVQLRLVYNPGAAFGLNLGPHSRWIFLIIAAVAVVALWRMARATPRTDRFRLAALGAVAGGAAGNLVDRVRSGRGVVDFLDVGIDAARWPTFNVADIGVSCGAVALAVSLWLEDARRPSPETPAPS
jgi:signal peptidase II